MKRPDVWGRIMAGMMTRPRNDNRLEANWLNAKALYDEAHEHLKLYETLYAQAHAIDMACRRGYAGGHAGKGGRS
jgi:hypothetical protein